LPLLLFYSALQREQPSLSSCKRFIVMGNHHEGVPLQSLENDMKNVQLNPESIPLEDSPLLRLPFELRLHIYHCFIPRKTIGTTSQAPFNKFDWLCEGIPRVYGARSRGRHDGSREEPLQGGTIEENRSAIFVVSKQISEEALDVLYGDNFF
jgi:hypothetical protein